MSNKITKEEFKKLSPGDILVTDAGTEYTVIRNADNTPPLVVTTTRPYKPGTKPTKYDELTFVKIK